MLTEELKKSLREMQDNPTTGTAHNQQLISTQVETIFMLDELHKEISKLNTTIENADKQSQRLERSNYRLQLAMVILTAITTIIIVYPVAKYILVSFFTLNIFGFSLTATVASLIAAAVAGIAAGAILAKEKKAIDKVLKINVSN